MRALFLIVFLSLLPIETTADETRNVQLHAPAALVESGLLKYILPRFSLKTRVRVDLVDSAQSADLTLGAEGRALFQGQGDTWHLAVHNTDHAGTQRLADWLTSEIGARTIFAYAPDGTALFAPPSKQTAQVAAVEVSGDADAGYKVSQAKCARCHAVDERGRKNDIGSTPSFFVLRSMGDWQERFGAFYVLNPHPAFTQVDGVTEPFPVNRPPPIVPITLTLDEIEAVMAYVAVLKAADLGEPVRHQ